MTTHVNETTPAEQALLRLTGHGYLLTGDSNYSWQTWRAAMTDAKWKAETGWLAVAPDPTKTCEAEGCDLRVHGSEHPHGVPVIETSWDQGEAKTHG